MKAFFSTTKSATAKVASPPLDYADKSKPPPSPPRSTARTPEHTRPNSPENDDASVKRVPNPPVCYWILPHDNIAARHPRDVRPRKAHPDFPAILVIRPDGDGYIVDVLTQSTRSTLAVTQDEAKYFKTRDYKEFQAENLAKLLLIHYNRMQPGRIVEEDTVFQEDLVHLDSEHRIKCFVIDCPKRHQALMSALQAAPAHKDHFANMVEKLQKDAVLTLDHAVGHALRQYRQVSARVGVLHNGDRSTNDLAQSLVTAWSSLNLPVNPDVNRVAEGTPESEYFFAKAINAFCTSEKKMLDFKQYMQLAAWQCTPEQAQVWGAPLQALFSLAKPEHLQKLWIDYEHHFECSQVEDALALIGRISDVALLREFSRIHFKTEELSKKIHAARTTWEGLHPHLATPMTDAVNQQFDTKTLNSVINGYAGYFAGLCFTARPLLQASQRVPRGQPLVKPLEELLAKIDAVAGKNIEVSDVQYLTRVLGGQEQVIKYGLQRHSHLDASLVTFPQTALKLKSKPQTLLLFGPRLIVAEGALLFNGQPVTGASQIPTVLTNAGKKLLTVRRSFDASSIAVSLVASADAGGPVVLEITDSSLDTFEYRVEKGKADGFLATFDAVQARIAFSQTHDGGPGNVDGHVKVATRTHDAVDNLFIGAVEGVRNAHDMGRVLDHLVYCYSLGEADQKWTPAMCASMSTVLPSIAGGYVVQSHFLQQSGRARQPTCVTTQVESIDEAARTLHKLISGYNCIYNATYSSPNARIRADAIRSRLLGESAVTQVTSGSFIVMKRKHIPGGTQDTASSSSVRMQPSMMQINARMPFRPIVESVRSSVRESLNQLLAEPSSPNKITSPTKMEAALGSRFKTGTFGAGFGRPGSIAGSLNSIGSRLTTVGRMVMGMDTQLQGPATLQSVLFSACTYFMDLVISGVNLSMVPVTGAANAALEVAAPVGSSSKTQRVRWTMVHTPLLNELKKSGKFKPELARTMFPIAVFNALAEYFSCIDAVISISQFCALLDNVQGAVRTLVNFHNEIQPVINMLLEPIQDGAINGQPTPSNLLKSENLRLFLFIVYFFEFSRIQFTDKLHLCFPQPTSSEPFQQMMATKISTSTFVMAALLKGSTGSSNRPADVALVKKLAIGVAAPAIADKLKVESKNKRIIGSPRALMDKLADMEKRVLSRITPKGEKGSLRSVVQMTEAAEEWRRWSEARNMEARAKAAAAAKATAAAANKSVPSSPKAAAPLVPDVFKGLPEVDSGAATLARPQADDALVIPQEQLALKCALPLSRTGSDAAIELRHASSSEATVADHGHQPATLVTSKVIESVVAATGNLSAVEQGR